MTLPNPNKPDISDTVETIVTDIQENCSYIDTNPSAYSIVYITRSSGDGTGVVEYSGVGFRPRAIIFLGIGSLGDGGVGYYGISTGKKYVCYVKNRYIRSGYFSSDNWSISPGKVTIMQYCVDNDGLTNNLLATMYSTSTLSETTDDGFRLLWMEYDSDNTETYYLIAICIK